MKNFLKKKKKIKILVKRENKFFPNITKSKSKNFCNFEFEKNKKINSKI